MTSLIAVIAVAAVLSALALAAILYILIVAASAERKPQPAQPRGYDADFEAVFAAISALETKQTEMHNDVRLVQQALASIIQKAGLDRA